MIGFWEFLVVEAGKHTAIARNESFGLFFCDCFCLCHLLFSCVRLMSDLQSHVKAFVELFNIFLLLLYSLIFLFKKQFKCLILAT